jgi:hypothetical protein
LLLLDGCEKFAGESKLSVVVVVVRVSPSNTENCPGYTRARGQYHNTHLSTMPTPRLVYLTEQQYAGMMDHAHAGAANNTTAEEQLLYIDNQEQNRLPIADATRNASSNKPPAGEEKKVEEQSDHHEEDDDYLDTVLQESIDGVNRRSFGENDSPSSERVRVEDAFQQFQHEMVSSDKERENESTPSAQVQRKRPAPKQSFDDHFNDLLAFKAKYSHCDVPCIGENTSLGRWCSEMRVSYKKIQNKQKPKVKLFNEQIQRLNDAGFKWSLRPLKKSSIDDNRKRSVKWEERVKQLKRFQENYGHLRVPKSDPELGVFVNRQRYEYTKMMAGKSSSMNEERLHELTALDFVFQAGKTPKSVHKKSWEERYQDLVEYQGKKLVNDNIILDGSLGTIQQILTSTKEHMVLP